MNGELAVLIALCLHGNEWLASAVAPAPALDTSNSTFQYVSRVHATSPQRRLLGTRTWEADGVAPWLEHLATSGTRRLTFVDAGASPSGLPEPVAAAFAGGGRWALASDGPSPRLWRSHWSVQDRSRSDGRIWAVELTGAPQPRPVPVHGDWATARDSLRQALDAIRGFADTTGLGFWAAWFAEAIELLDAPDPVVPYNPDLAPAALGIESRRLLAAAVKAWVFGGMGSWNDVVPADAGLQDEYDRRTAELYAAVMGAVAAVTNDAG